MPDTVVLCGGVQAPIRRNEAALPLNLSGPGANITLRLEDISRPMVTDVPDVLTDLLEVATYVYCADQLVSRGGEVMQALGSQWRRSLKFIVPVRELDLWTSQAVCEALQHLLAFLSDDDIRFQFVQAASPPALNTYLDFSESRQPRFSRRKWSCSRVDWIRSPGHSMLLKVASPGFCWSATSRPQRWPPFSSTWLMNSRLGFPEKSCMCPFA